MRSNWKRKKAMPERLGDAPTKEAFQKKMEQLGTFIDVYCNGEDAQPRRRNIQVDKRRVGFVLLLFEFGHQPSRCNFISNGADRREIVALFKEMISRFEGQPEI
jgi:hypothetical protein